MCKKTNCMISLVFAVGMAFGWAGSAQAEDVVLTFSDLEVQGNDDAVAVDYQPPELAGTGITMTWTNWWLFNDDIAGEGLRDHTESWDPAAASIYVFTDDDGGSMAFNSPVEVSSMWIFQDPWADTAVAGYLGGQEVWSVPADHPEEWVEITAGAGQMIDEIIATSGWSRIDDMTIGVSSQAAIIATFSDLEGGGEGAIAEDYQPSELEGTGVSATFVGWYQFDDNMQGEGLRDHTESWAPEGPSVYVFVYDDAPGSIEFNPPVQVPSLWIFQDSWAFTAVSGHLGGQELWSVPADHPLEWVEITAGDGHMIDTLVAEGGFSRIDDIMIGKGVSHSAVNPSPADDAEDVPRDVVLGWEPGTHAATHNVYFGTSASAVTGATVTNPLDVLLVAGHDANSYDPGMTLDLGQTYHWRVDEVNAAPDDTVYRGEVWRFTAEPFSYPLQSVTATASSSSADNTGPEKTVDGSGLNEQDQHSIAATDMWISAAEANPWIQYEFDKTYKLHELWVWNSNQLVEPFVGFGAKDVTIETSGDGVEWTALAGPIQFNQATGLEDYTANTVVDFSGALARFVRITVHTGWGIMPQFGLSEVRFSYIPTHAREPKPLDGATTAGADVQLSWRAGREAASHQVYLGTDPGDLALVGTTAESSFDAGALSHGTAYYWSVTEVNEAATPTAYAGPIWSFSTAGYTVVDDFDQYDDLCDRIFFAWKDGLGHNGGTEIDDCDVAPYNGNGSGSIVGHAQAPFAERNIVNAGSRQSLPIEYDNASGPSEAQLPLPGQDWTSSGIQTLSLFFRGAADNTGQLYVKINGAKLLYDRAPADIARAAWQAWNIDLTGVAGLDNVTELTIGVDGASAAGMLYIDDIRLYALAGELITPTEPTTGLVAHYDFENNAQDDSGQGNHGALVGDARFANDPDRGTVLNLNGVDAIVEVPHSASLGFGDSTNMTLAVWLKPGQVPRSSWTGVVTKNRAANADDGYGIWISASNEWHFRVGPTAGNANLSGASEVTEEWHSVVMTHDADTTTVRGYLDGWLIHEDTNSDPTPFTVQDALWIGGAENVPEYYPGMIDEVSLFNRPLSPEEVLWLAGVAQPVHKPF